MIGSNLDLWQLAVAENVLSICGVLTIRQIKSRRSHWTAGFSFCID